MSDEPYSPVPELNLLKEFDDRIGPVFYADGFELLDYGSDVGLGTWSEDPGFLSRLVPFAQANGSGSAYALWRCDDRPESEYAGLPVVFVGDEGELYVIARSLTELFRLLALDVEPLSDIGFHRAGSGNDRADDHEDDHSEAHEEYLAWLEANFGLAPPEDPKALWAERTADDDRFRAWAGRYVELHDA